MQNGYSIQGVFVIVDEISQRFLNFGVYFPHDHTKDDVNEPSNFFTGDYNDWFNAWSVFGKSQL